MTAKAEEEEKKNKNMSFRLGSSCPVPEAPTSDFQMPTQSGVIAASSLAQKKKKCQVDGDFLLGDFTGVVTVQCGREVPRPSLISGA